MSVMFATVARNEDQYIAEWLAFHILGGIEAFIIFDNDSNDTTKFVAQQFSIKHNVRIISWPTPVNAAFVSYQAAAYSQALKVAADEQVEWLMFTDIDEFTFSENNAALGQRLDALPGNIGAVAVKPYDFGSNYRRDKPSRGLVIENFRRSVSDEFARTPGFIKTIGRTTSIIGMQDAPHSILLKSNSRYSYPDGSQVEQDTVRPGIVTNPFIGNIVQHHYITKSFAEFNAKRARYVGKTRHIADSYFVNREAVCNAVDRPTLVPMAEAVNYLIADVMGADFKV